jgi:hypothetical protein
LKAEEIEPEIAMAVSRNQQIYKHPVPIEENLFDP